MTLWWNCTTKRFVFLKTISRSIRSYTKVTEWHESDLRVDRKSTFQARHTELHDSDDIPLILDQLLSENKQINKASQPHMIAWRTGAVHQVIKSVNGKPDKGKNKNGKKKGKSNDVEKPESNITYSNIQQGFKDNGEKAAGSKLLEILVNHNLMNILVIATRWYGGNPIGSLRFRHIVNSAYDSLRKGNKLN